MHTLSGKVTVAWIILDASFLERGVPSPPLLRFRPTRLAAEDIHRPDVPLSPLLPLTVDGVEDRASALEAEGVVFLFTEAMVGVMKLALDVPPFSEGATVEVFWKGEATLRLALLADLDVMSVRVPLMVEQKA